MSEDSWKEQITVRVIRDGVLEPPENDWSMATPEERIEAVWMLTELCLAWNNPPTSVPRLQELVPAFNERDMVSVLGLGPIPSCDLDVRYTCVMA